MKNLTIHNIIFSLAFSFLASNAMANDAQLLEVTHKNAGLVCNDCHTKDKQEVVRITKCLECHDTADLAETTADFKPTNPHKNRHFDTETNCSYCHHQHKESENYCEGCHQRFDFVTP